MKIIKTSGWIKLASEEYGTCSKCGESVYLLLSDQEVYDNDVLCENCKKDVKEKLKKDIPPNGVPLNPGWVNIMDPRSVTGPRSRRS